MPGESLPSGEPTIADVMLAVGKLATSVDNLQDAVKTCSASTVRLEEWAIGDRLAGKPGVQDQVDMLRRQQKACFAKHDETQKLVTAQSEAVQQQKRNWRDWFQQASITTIVSTPVSAIVVWALSHYFGIGSPPSSGGSR